MPLTPRTKCAVVTTAAFFVGKQISRETMCCLAMDGCTVGFSLVGIVHSIRALAFHVLLLVCVAVSSLLFRSSRPAVALFLLRHDGCTVAQR